MQHAVVALLSLAVFWAGHTHAVVHRCFACRSRGEQGDCRDPFFLSSSANASSDAEAADVSLSVLESKRAGVDVLPCASGWCSKVLEGADKSFKDDFGSATERDCMKWPPSDGKERCAFIKWHRKQVYMCFCKGDLCNGARNTSGTFLRVFLAAIAALILARARKT
jgi:hypothetical protein